MKFQFLNREHEDRFSEFRTEMTEHHRHNKEYLSVIYIMTGNKQLYDKMKPYFKVDDFDSINMFEEIDFNENHLVLAMLAVHLCNSNEAVNPLQIISKLDEESFKLALNAIILRRYGVSKGYDLPEEKLYM